EQNPHTVLTAVSGCKRPGVRTSPNALGRSTNSRVKGPSQSRNKDFGGDLIMNRRLLAFWQLRPPEKTMFVPSILRRGKAEVLWPSSPTLRSAVANSTKADPLHL